MICAPIPELTGYKVSSKSEIEEQMYQSNIEEKARAGSEGKRHYRTRGIRISASKLADADHSTPWSRFTENNNNIHLAQNNGVHITSKLKPRSMITSNKGQCTME